MVSNRTSTWSNPLHRALAARRLLAGLFLLAFATITITIAVAADEEPVPGEAEYAERATRMLVAATEAGDELATFQAQQDLARHMMTLSLWPQALIHANLARQAVSKSGDEAVLLAADILYGRILSYLERASEATDILLLALERVRALGDVEQELWTLLGLSGAYLHARLLDSAEEFTQQGLALAKATDNRLLQVRFLNNLGLIAWTAGDVERARDYIDGASAIDVELPIDVHKVLALASITLAGAQDRADAARARELIEQSRRDGSIYMGAFATEQLGRILCSNGEHEEALSQFAAAEVGFRETESIGDLRRLHEFWVECLVTTGQFEQALQHQQEATRLLEETQQLRQTDTLQALDAAFRTEQRLAEMAQLASEEQRLQARLAEQRARMAGLIAGVFVLFAIAYALAMRNRVLRQKQQAADALVQARVDLLARTSHEIRNPAQALIGLLEADGARLDSEEGTAQLAAARMIGRLANDCLDLAMLEQGRLHLQSDRVYELRAFVDQVLTLARAQCSNEKIELRVHVELSVPNRVRLDGERLAQVLLNLLGNAMHYAGSGAIPLEVKLGADGGELLFTVQDQGPGLGPDPDALFDPYRRANVPNRNLRGAGLGLAISARIVHAMGGVIQARNRDPVGACFTVRVPLRRDAQVQRPRTLLNAQSRLALSTQVPERRVALIDDDPLVRLGLRALLESLGQDVHDRADAHGFEQMLEQFDPDLVLIDQHLDDSSGCDLARGIRDLDRHRSRQRLVVIVSGSSDPVDADTGSIDAWLVKPIGREDLLGLLRRCREVTGSEC